MALTDGRTIVLYSDGEQVTLGDLRKIVGMANAPARIPDADPERYSPMPDDAPVRLFYDGTRAGILLEGRR